MYAISLCFLGLLLEISMDPVIVIVCGIIGIGVAVDLAPLLYVMLVIYFAVDVAFKFFLVFPRLPEQK